MTAFRSFPDESRGFTLMELLVVVTILSILAALCLPGYEYARMQAYAVAAASNLRQLTEANLTYATDNGRFCPTDDWWNNRRWCGARVAEGQKYDPTKGFLAEYLGKSRRVTPDPLFTLMLQQKKITSFEYGSGGYGYNDYVGGAISLDNTPTYDSTPQRVRIGLNQIRVDQPAETIMFGTTALAYGDRVQEYPFLHPPFWTDDYGNPVEFYGRASPSLHFRYNGKALVSWCDGHVSFVTCDDQSWGRNPGWSPYGGNATKQKLGWFGPDENNGYWNPRKL